MNTLQLVVSVSVTPVDREDNFQVSQLHPLYVLFNMFGNLCIIWVFWSLKVPVQKIEANGKP